jgi:hypothetical protein
MARGSNRTAWQSSLTSSSDQQAEYEHAIQKGNEIISRAKPLLLSKQSIEEIHYWYCYAANVLIQEGKVPQHKIVGKLYEDFGQFYGINWIYDILKESSIDLPKDASLVNQNSDSSLNTPKILPENQKLHEGYCKVKDAIDAFIAKLDKPFCSLLGQKELHEDITLMNGLSQIALDVADERRLVATAAQPIFLRCAIDFTLQHAYSKHLLIVKDVVKKLYAESKIRGIRTIEVMTGKQSNRTAYLRIQDLHESLEPASEDEARIKGFSGQICPACNCRRCERVPDASEGRWYTCIRCSNKFEGKTLPAYTRAGVVIDSAEVVTGNATFMAKVDDSIS